MYNDIEQDEGTPVFCSDFARFAQHKSFAVMLHGLRHTHASLLLKRGVSIQYDFARLGHESIEITYKTYSHFLPGDDGGSSEDWGEKSGRAEGHLQPASRCLILIFCHG